VGLWLVLEWYGAASEVPWLFLLSAWILALMVATFAYAAWNRSGLRLRLEAHGSRPAADSPVDALPDNLLRSAPWRAPVFEGDGLELEVGLTTTGAPRGPAWVTGLVGGRPITFATGLVPRDGWRRVEVLHGLRRGAIGATGWQLGTSDPLGFFNGVRSCPDVEVAVVLPLFTSLVSSRQPRELEASVAAPRAGSGNELFGIREYRPGDSLRRIHWRSSARHGELVVREYEPPGMRTLAILVDPSPPSAEVADQVARLAASEAWDCIREGGRVSLWAPGLEPTEPSPGRDLWALLEWLARYPAVPSGGVVDTYPPSGEVVVITGSGDRSLIDAAQLAKQRGSGVRAWVVGDAELDLDAPVRRVGTEWPV
jgi:uncharacterized protein (DUF58 family)